MNKLRLAICLLFLCLVSSCGSIEPVATTTADLKDVSLLLESVIYAKSGTEVTIRFVEGKGPLQTDKVVLRPEREDVNEETCDIISIGSSDFRFKLPVKFSYGSYKFCLRRDGQLKGYGTVEFAGSAPSGPESGGFTPGAGMTVYGQVSCGGKPVAGVVVSDGYEVVASDKDGYYQMASKKQAGYVFISIPSGYEVESNGVLPVFHKKLYKDAKVVERADFTLFESGDQTNHTVLYFGDMHMAKRTNDQAQFKTFTSEINQYVSSHPADKIYAITLGDMTWDLYWYSNTYCFAQYLNDINVVKNLQIFHTIGNHDHDMNVVGDWEGARKFRDEICPNYYSFNIGKIHYVVLDDIESANTTASQTDGGVRNHIAKLVSEDLEWLKKDLAFVPKTTPVVVTLHAPVLSKDGGNALQNADNLKSVLSGYNATIVSGHTHVVYNADKNGIKEYNSGAVCGAWWWAGKYYPTFNVSTDGAPNGYRITTVTGTEQKSLFKAIGRTDDYQFRSYDRNKISLTAENTGVPSSKAGILASEDKGSYATSSSANEVIINVWDYDTGWKVEVTENGKALSVSQLKNAYDPAFLLGYTIPRLKEADGVTWHQSATNHLFKVTASSATSTLEIKVTDDEGREYKETMKRPKDFTIDTYR